MKSSALVLLLAFGAVSGLALACLLAVAGLSEIAARMRMHRGDNQYQKSPTRESRVGHQGESAEITAQKIIEERAAARMRQATLNNRKPETLTRESRVSGKGESAEITAQKIIEEKAAARMRQVALAGTRPNQLQADLGPESRPRSKGRSAEITTDPSQSIYTDRYNYQPCDLGLSIG